MQNTIFTRLTELLSAGKLLALETDTVPGIAGLALRTGALAQLYRVKRRSRSKPIVWMISDIAYMEPYIAWETSMTHFIEKYWPGALTVVLPLNAYGKKICGARPGITDSIALRQPADPTLCALMDRLKEPLAVTSANYSDHKELLDLRAVREQFGFAIDGYYERGKPMSLSPSTVIDLTQKTPVILRQGGLTVSLDNHQQTLR